MAGDIEVPLIWGHYLGTAGDPRVLWGDRGEFWGPLNLGTSSGCPWGPCVLLWADTGFLGVPLVWGHFWVLLTTLYPLG